MIELNIPGQGIIQLEHLVCDVNGTLAVDGNLIEGVVRSVAFLSDRLKVHLLTADTFGRQAAIDQRLGLTAVRLQPGDEGQQKAAYVEQLNAAQVIAIGQGANDAQMLRSARIGICLISPEGTAVETLIAADIVAPDILSAFAMIEKPLRLVATLRK
jgi:P-type E1-E2 ATPase